MGFLLSFSIFRLRECCAMSRLSRFSALFLCCLSPLAVQGQAAPAPAAPGTPTAVQPAPASAPSAPAPAGAGTLGGNIHLDIVVTDHSGKAVPGLTASDFTVLDNNQPSRILSFQAYDAPANPPAHAVQVVILFDTVNTDFNTVSYTRQQVSNYLRRNGGHLPQPVTLAWLTNTAIEPQGPPSLDGNALATALDAAQGRLRTVTNAAGFYGAVERFELSARVLEALLRNEMKFPGRKMIIWAGPGWPMLDNPTINISNKGQKAMFGEIVELSTMLREAQVDLYSVSQGTATNDTFLYESFLKGVKKSTQASTPNLGLKVLAIQSGGLVLPPTNDVASSIDTCIHDAATYYSVTFAPPPADGPDEYHKLDVHVDKPGLTARTNTGYYNQPPAAGGQH
jgi:VWFA-related protein